MAIGAPTDELLVLLNPKNYRYLPSKYTNNIRFAGRMTAASERASAVIAQQKA